MAGKYDQWLTYLHRKQGFWMLCEWKLIAPNVNPFIIKKVLDDEVSRGFDFVIKLWDGSLIDVLFNSQIKDLKLTQIHSLQVKVTLPDARDIRKEVMFHRDFRTMDESEILENMNDQSVEVKCITKLDGNVRTYNWDCVS